LACVIFGLQRIPLKLFAYCVMPNHFHLVAQPQQTAEISQFMQLVTAMHSRRWHRSRGSSGTGCVYQGRYRAVVIKRDEQFLTVCRYVEQNALRARLVERAEDWPWSSLFQRCRNCHSVPLQPWPILQPLDWLDFVNQPESAADIRAIRWPIGPRPGGRPPKTARGSFT
jgi:putative transposase